MQNRPLKICLVGHSLASGGAERAMASLSFFFAENDLDVHIVTVVDQVEYKYGGTLFNLGKFQNRLQKFLKLKSYLSQHRFDYIIDFRMRPGFWQEWFTQKLIYNAPTIYTVHSARLDWYFPKSEWQVQKLYASAHGIVTVSRGIADLIKPVGVENVSVIPNPMDVETIKRQSMESIDQARPYILAVGRLDQNKQFGQLIRAYAKSALARKNIELIILGDGPLREKLNLAIKDLNLANDVKLLGSVSNPYRYFKNALFTVLSSKNEGLPTVLLESLCCQTPVISFDCPTGPREIVRHRENGLLVKDQDFEALTAAMDAMASDENLRLCCVQNSSVGIDRYAIENIGRQWLDLLKIRLS